MFITDKGILFVSKTSFEGREISGNLYLFIIVSIAVSVLSLKETVLSVLLSLEVFMIGGGTGLFSSRLFIYFLAGGAGSRIDSLDLLNSAVSSHFKRLSTSPVKALIFSSKSVISTLYDAGAFSCSNS